MRIFSGIQPTGRKHLGNYIGAITQWVAGQDRGEALYCVVDLHALTVAYEPEALRESVYDTAATLLAAGLDPERCIFFRQSDVTEHPELCWLLSSVTSFGELNRMTQFKDKSGAQRELVSAGLFTYPVLQAADVLAYRAHEVPVGEDQRQHVELMRDVAERFNARFGETFVVPEVRMPEVGARIMDLQAPDRKMSTTGGTPQGTVLVLDEPDVIVKKVRSAVTDSGSGITKSPEKPGISNLIDILAAVRGTTPEQVERDFDGSGYGAFKQAVADAVVEYLAPVRERYEELRADEPGLERTLAEGAEKARAIASGVARGRPHGDGRRASPVAPLTVCAVRLVDLELDLDVFAGPFDLLLTLILREEVDLLEVDLAEVVIAYIDHLEQRGELDLEAATEFLVLIAALLELKSRLMLPGEEIEEIELDPGEAAEELLGAPARRAPLRRGGDQPARAPRRPGGLPVPLRAAAAVAAARVAGRCRRRVRPDKAGRRDRRSAAPARAGRRPSHLRAEGHGRRAPRASPRPAQARQLQLRRGGRARGPGDGRRHPVRGARALQAGRADLASGSAVRRDHDRRQRARPETARLSA